MEWWFRNARRTFAIIRQCDPSSKSVRDRVSSSKKEIWVSCANARFSFVIKTLWLTRYAHLKAHMSRGGRGGFGRGGGAPLCILYVIA